MTAFVLVMAGAVGAVVGSFLNVVIWRLPLGESVVSPRSRCPGCLAPIAAYDNLPILSWLLLRGRCRGCGMGISARYPFVEALTAALFVAAAWRWIDHLPTAGLVALVLAAFVAITFIDWDHKIIPDRITKPGIFLGIVLAPVSVGEGLLHPAHWIAGQLSALGAVAHAAAGAVVGAAVILGIRILGTLVFKKEAMGLGDVKLLAFIGAFTGPLQVLYALVLASVAGAVIGGLRWWIGRNQPLRFPLTVRWNGGEASFPEAWVDGKDLVLTVVPPPEGAASLPGGRVRLALSLPAADVLEEEDQHLNLRATAASAERKGRGTLWRFTVERAKDEERELLAFFALSRRYVPFGPFLCLGGALTLFFGAWVHWLIVEGYPTWARGLIT